MADTTAPYSPPAGLTIDAQRLDTLFGGPVKRILTAALLAVIVSLVAVPSATANVLNDKPAPAVTKKYAEKMDCKWGEATSMASGGPNRGIGCIVRNRNGRAEFNIIRYENIDRALDYWRDWLSWDSEYSDGPSAYFVRKGNVIITEQGHDPYSLEWSKYAAQRVDGRLLSGYKY